MDGKNGLLALGAYLTVALLVILAGLWAVMQLAVEPRLPSVALVDPGRTAPTVATRMEKRVLSNSAEIELTTAEQRRVDLLEAMLRQKNDRLLSQAERIEEQEQAYRQLLTRYDEAMALGLEYLTATAEKGPTLGPTIGPEEMAGADRIDTTNNAAERVVANLPGAPEKQPMELNRVLAEEDSLAAEMQAIENELDVTLAQLDQERAGRQRLVDEQLQAIAALEGATADLISQTGPAAVERLRQALRQDNPIVRRWAANVLGKVGSDASPAIADLTLALMDADDRVRQAARNALDAIER